MVFKAQIQKEVTQLIEFETIGRKIIAFYIYTSRIWQHLFRTFHYSYKLWGIARRKSVQIFIFKSAYLTKNVYLSLLLSLPIIRYIVCKPSEPGQIVKSNSVRWVVEFLVKRWVRAGIFRLERVRAVKLPIRAGAIQFSSWNQADNTDNMYVKK